MIEDYFVQEKDTEYSLTCPQCMLLLREVRSRGRQYRLPCLRQQYDRLRWESAGAVMGLL